MNKKVYLYDVNMNFIREFKTTYECAEFFDKDVGYINHNLKYYQKIRKDGVWYIIKRDFEKEKKYEDLCKEIERLNKENDYYFKMNNELSTLNTSLRSDRDRLNNIINELEKWLKEHSNIDYNCKETIIHEQLALNTAYEYLKALKEDNK